MILSFLPKSTETFLLFNVIKQNYELTKSIVNFSQYQSTIPTSLESSKITLRSNIISQTLITKPNSYLYNPDEDDDNDNSIQRNRVKRESKPFVCESKILFILFH